eukprot:1153735-Pelagomonas_calceolata.AAC.1
MRKSTCCATTPPSGRTEMKIFTPEMHIASTAGNPLWNCKSLPTPHSKSGTTTPQAIKREAGVWSPKRFQRFERKRDARASMARKANHSRMAAMIANLGASRE